MNAPAGRTDTAVAMATLGPTLTYGMRLPRPTWPALDPGANNRRFEPTFAKTS